MQHMKDTFIIYCKSDFRQPKFHMTLHHIDVIRRFGSVRYADAGPGERLHKVAVKPAFRRTSMRKGTAQEELIIAIRYTSYLSALVREYNITVRAPPSVPSVHGSDSFLGPFLTFQSFKWSPFHPVACSLPGNTDEQQLHFQQGLVPALLKHSTGCSHTLATRPDKRKELIKRFTDKYHRPQIFKTFVIKFPGELRTLTLRAHASFQNAPWFDFVRCRVQEVGAGGDGSVEYAGRAIAFVSLRSMYTGEEEWLVLVEWYVSCLAPARRRGPRSNSQCQDLRSVHPHLPFPAIKLQEAVTKRWDLMDTEVIRGGLWVQQDFSDPKRFWVLTSE